MSQLRKSRYRATNWKQYSAALKARGSLTVWLDKRECWFATASGKRGSSPKFSDAATLVTVEHHIRQVAALLHRSKNAAWRLRVQQPRVARWWIS